MNKSIIPNFFTGSNLAFGVLSITFSAQGNFNAAAWCILFSLLADALDGRTARALGVSGPFGRELDSLADVVGFGVAPAFMIYARELSELGWVGYIPLLVFAVLGGFRLARFNIMTTEIKGFFQGLPIPTAGCTCAAYVLSGVFFPLPVVMVAMVALGFLMVSEIHYPDFKGQAADVMNKGAIGFVAVAGLYLLWWDMHTWMLLPFVLFTFFGIVNTALNRMRKDA